MQGGPLQAAPRLPCVLTAVKHFFGMQASQTQMPTEAPSRGSRQDMGQKGMGHEQLDSTYPTQAADTQPLPIHPLLLGENSSAGPRPSNFSGAQKMDFCVGT